VKESVRYVTGTNAQDGVATAIDKFALRTIQKRPA